MSVEERLGMMGVSDEKIFLLRRLQRRWFLRETHSFQECRNLFDEEEIKMLEDLNMRLDIPVAYYVTEEKKSILNKLVGTNEKFILNFLTKGLLFITEAKSGNLNTMKWMNKENVTGSDWISAFDGACEGGHLPVVKYLTAEKGHSLYKKSIQNSLLNAAEKGHFPVVKYLVEEYNAKPIDTNPTEEPDDDALMIASVNGHLDIVRYLFEERKMDPNLATNLLSCICEECNRKNEDERLEVVKYLVEHLKVDPTDKNSYTPLTNACGSASLKIVRYLVRMESPEKE